jgi:predicted nucleotidyltransferase
LATLRADGYRRGVDLAFDSDAALRDVRAFLPDVVALYCFGSFARGDDNADSDVDLAVLPRRPLPATLRFAVQEELARRLGRDVDLIDLRAASTVLRVQVLAADVLLYDGDQAAREVFEAETLSDYARLNEERRGILEDVIARGSVYGGGGG